MDADEIARVLSVRLHSDCPFGNEHIARMTNYETGDKLATCRECYDVAERVVGTDLIEQARQEGAREAWEGAADEAHRGARYVAEMTMRGQRPDPLDRVTVLEHTFRDRAERAATPACGCPSGECVDAGAAGCYFGAATPGSGTAGGGTQW